jgi:predicted RNA methylase
MNEDPTVLLSPPGQELLARLAAAGNGAAGDLALAVSLRREYPANLVAAAMAQHELRLAARAKFSRAMEMLFTRSGYEQSSSEIIAAHRAVRFAAAGRVADLCCGIGGDLIALAAASGAVAPPSAASGAASPPSATSGPEVLAVDRDSVHARLALHNAAVYGAADGVRACVADVRDIALGNGIDAVFIDPARRNETRRFRAGVSEPPLDWCLSLADRVPAVCVKAAPGLPADLIPPGWEAEFIADGRDLKEAVLWSPAMATTARRATILPGGDTLVAEPGPESPRHQVPVAGPGEYLLDPSPAVTRAGLVEDLARRLGAWKIDPQIAFLAAKANMSTPFARTLRVVDSAPWNEKRFGKRLRELGVGAADLRRRGLAGDVEHIRPRLKLTGPHRATVVLTRADGKPWGLICTDPDSPLSEHRT